MKMSHIRNKQKWLTSKRALRVNYDCKEPTSSNSCYTAVCLAIYTLILNSRIGKIENVSNGRVVTR